MSFVSGAGKMWLVHTCEAAFETSQLDSNVPECSLYTYQTFEQLLYNAKLNSMYKAVLRRSSLLVLHQSVTYGRDCVSYPPHPFR